MIEATSKNYLVPFSWVVQFSFLEKHLGKRIMILISRTVSDFYVFVTVQIVYEYRDFSVLRSIL